MTPGTACAYPPCTPCWSGALSLDDGQQAVWLGGYCVCSGGIWSCARATSWPAPTDQSPPPWPPSPVCDAAVAKGEACSSEGSVCYGRCGPKGVGYEKIACAQGVYVDGDCQFDPAGDRSCFDPALGDVPICPGDKTAVDGDACSAPDCSPCGPEYIDASGNSVSGLCVCDAATGRWSCSSFYEWP